MTDADIGAARAVLGRARTAGDRTAIVDEDTRISYAELGARIRSLAAVLAGGGVRPGDRVAYVGRNSATQLTAALAAIHLGAIFVPLSFRLTAAELGPLLAGCGAHTLLADGDFAAAVDGVRPAGRPRRLLRADAGPPAAGWEPLRRAAPGRRRPTAPARTTRCRSGRTTPR